ncbi:MAG TPA: YncE family protein [Bryobacteraceae bacterium]|nr:YncE family protein [Bryobacteraceae bacterium]
MSHFRNGWKWGFLLLAFTLAADDRQGMVFHASDHGVSIEAGIAAPDGGAREHLRENEDVAVRFRLTDTASGSPVRGAYISAWLAPAPAAGLPQASCNTVISGLLNAKTGNPGVDLNNYYVLAMNNDATITVVDPLFGYGGTKLLALIPLPAVAEDWVQLAERDRIFVSLPEARQVAVIDTRTWKIIAAIPVPSKPHRTVLQPDGSQVWVTLESGSVGVLSTAEPKFSGEVRVGKGDHTIAFSSDNRYAAVTSSGDGTVSLVDVASRKVTAVPAGQEPISVAFSPLSQMFYIADRKGGSVLPLDPASGRTSAPIVLRPGLGEIRFAPGGRYGFVVNPENDRLYILDSASNQLMQTGQVDKGPDQVVFSDRLAYIRHRGSENVLMISLDTIGKKDAPLAPADFPAGQHRFGEVSIPSPADGFAPAPGENAVLVANPADKAIYYYQVGMAAPQGSFSNYSREPRAILVVDRSIQAKEPGVYTTVMRLPGRGAYNLAMLVDNPQVVQCFPVTVEANPQIPSSELRWNVEFAEISQTPRAGEKLHIRFRLIDASRNVAQSPVRDARVMVALQGGNWSNPNPQFAVPEGGGVYGFDAVPPEPGHYLVLVECPSLGLPLHRSSQLQFDVQP